MIQRKDIEKILDNYDMDNVTIGVLGSHSALDVCRGAKDIGFKTLVICEKGRDKTYSKYYKTAQNFGKTTGVVDEVLMLDKFNDILNPEIAEKMRAKNVVFIPHRSFEVYVNFDYEKIENEFLIPLFGTREILKAEERTEEKNQYYLMEKAGIRYPRQFKSYKDIDRLVIVKANELERSYEREFFIVESPAEFESKTKEMIEKKIVTEESVRDAVIEEYIVGTHVNFNYFYSPLRGEVELLGTDTRRQTNLDGMLRLTADEQLKVLKYVKPTLKEIGHIACTTKESVLEMIFDLGEKFVNATKQEYPPGIIGPFALQGAIIPGPPKEEAIIFDVSLRVQGSPGTRFTPYPGYFYNEEMSTGKRIALEIKEAIKKKRLIDIVT